MTRTHRVHPFALGLTLALSLSGLSCRRARLFRRPAELVPIPAPTPAVPPSDTTPTSALPPPGPPLVTGNGPLPGSPGSFAPLVRAVRTSVVSIFTADREISGFEYGFGNSEERHQRGLGTGFLVSNSGEILTNNHVIEGAAFIEAQLDDGRRFAATVVGRDPRLDVALLRLKAPGVRLQTARLGNSDAMQVGDWVMAIGNPYGLSQTVTAGIVSALDRTGSEVSLGPNSFGNLIQTDASINPGNSGGPLLNLSGEVIGINVAIHRTAQNVGFAIPINMARTVIDQLRQYGHSVRSWLGVSIRPIDERAREWLHLPDTHGALVEDVSPDSPAAQAGIRSGDIIRVFDGHAIQDGTQLPWLASSAGIGHHARLEFMRDGRAQTADVVLAALPEPTAPRMLPGSNQMVPIPNPFRGQ